MVANAGIVFQKPNEIVVQYKSEFQEHMAQIAMQFESHSGKIENLSVMVSNPDSINGLDFNISPVNYSG